jgi:hypothetical protein
MSAAAPANVDSGQRELFRSYALGRSAIYAYVIAGGAAFLVGAWQRSPLIMAAAPVAVVLLVVLFAFLAADRAAATRFYVSVAQSLGLLYLDETALLPLTPLLGAGDRRRCENWMQGVLPGDPPLPGGLGHFVFEDLRERRRSDGTEILEVSERRRFTLCVIELEPSIALFKGVFMRPRRGIFETASDWQKRGGLRTVELESAAFTDRYLLRITDDQDERRARELFSPALVSFLANHPLTPCVELKAGTLAVFTPRVIEDAGNLTFFLDAARNIAMRVLREVEEAAARPAA